MMAETVEKP